MDYQNLLNENQWKAVSSSAKYLRIIAGAGSGKTRVLTYRIAYLIDNMQVFPSQILAITFTNKAAKEIMERVERTLNKENLNLRIATFHSFCARILREDIRSIGYPSSFTILDEEDQKKTIKTIFEKLNIDAKNISISSCINYIEVKKNTFVSPADDLKQTQGNLLEHKKAEVYEAYENYLQKGFYLDFNDLILKTIEIFKKYPEILEKWQYRLKYILVDEFQDVDNVQYLFLRLLAGKELSICVVGDPDQTIYTWRGANIDIILNFDRDFAGTQTINLNQNYRSSGNILKIANKLIQNNFKRLKKDLYTQSSDGDEIHFYHGSNAFDEANYVANNIIDLYQNKSRYCDCAVLYRQNSQTADLEKAFMEHQIPYVIYGGIKFFSRKEIKDALCYLRLGMNFTDDLALTRIINSPKRKIGETTIKKIAAYATTEDLPMFEFLRLHQQEVMSLFKNKALETFVASILQFHDNLKDSSLKPDEVFYDFLRKNGYIDELIALEEDDRIENIKEFVSQLKRHLEKENTSVETFIQEVALYTAQDDVKDEDRVKLMTVHTAKGLEFENVFIYGLIDGIFPSARAIQESIDGLEEERRIFYVALTRAKKRLYLSDSGGYGYMGERFPSRFFREIKETVKRNHFEVKNDSLKTFENNSTIRNGSIIEHKVYGEGVVIRAYDGLIDVVFKDAKYGKKTMVANHPTIHLIR